MVKIQRFCPFFLRNRKKSTTFARFLTFGASHQPGPPKTWNEFLDGECPVDIRIELSGGIGHFNDRCAVSPCDPIAERDLVVT